MAEKDKTEFHDCKDEEETKSFLKKVKAGDALEFRRTGFYHHWGLCTGINEEGEVEVAHITAPEDTSILKAAMAACGCAATEKCGKFLENVGKPFKEPMRCVMSKQNSVRVNNSVDNHIKPFALDIILERVNKTLQDVGWECYHFALNNCEHYVNYCRNGNRVSLQSLQKGRLTFDYLATGASKLAEYALTPGICYGAIAVGTISVAAKEYIANRERRLHEQNMLEKNDGEDGNKD